MNIIKKIALVLPVIAIGLFIFTLSIIDKKDRSIPAGININTSMSGITIIHSNPESKSETSSSKDESSVTEDSVNPILPVTEIPQMTNIDVYPTVVTPFSKNPELQPLEKIEPVPVSTPSEIVLESIPLINHNTTYTSTTENTTGDGSISETSSLHTGTSSKLPSQTVETTVTSVPEIKINDWGK